MRKSATIAERIAVRAYYLSQKYPAASALSCWLLAEQTELQLVARRAASAKKAAATRKARAPIAVVAARSAHTAPVLRQ